VFMQLKNTRAPGASQARFCTPNPHADATRRSRLKFVWLDELKRQVADEAGRNACKIQKVSHRLVCDLAETVARYPSFALHGEVWAGQATLAFQLGVGVRQVRRALSVLLELKILSIKRPSRGQRRDTNTMVALLDERPLFAVVEDDHRVSPSAVYRTPTSPNHRATASSNSREEELKKDTSPVGPSDKSRRETPVAKEEESNFDELNSDGGCSQDDPRPSATKANSSKSGDDVALAFAQLMGVYPHPRGQSEKPAYEPMARRAWGALSHAQKAEAIDAAPYARGKTWLGHWLNDARETGIFELMKQSAAGSRVWVSENTPQHAAWTEYYRSRGTRLPTTQHRVNGELQSGWWFESEWPPKLKLVQRGGGPA
jgi:hypothetical protein